jgi:alanyl-tRNA synthetase
MPAKRPSSTSGGKPSPTNHTPVRRAESSGSAIRATFLRYFEENGHYRMPSSSLIPRNDPTVLLTTAGMQQMIPYFLGQEEPPRNRLTSVQKCFRTTDIESVGDASHLTFFEMLGNFSVGQYFKREAIAFAWDLLTNLYHIPAERLSPTVHPDDDEAPQYWQEVAGFPAGGITRLADNWWGPPGASGPCGPDSEIYYDRGAHLSCGNADCAPGCDRCQRYLEIWNLVFMQFYQDTEGKRTPLKQPNIDTGMGLERLAMVLQEKDSVFETDLFRPILDTFAALAGTSYGARPEHDRSLRVIADHGRALVFLAADGVQPDNTGRGYIFRRVLRRAVRHGKLLGLEGPFLARAADAVIDVMKGHYAELVERRDQILQTLTAEEERFGQTLNIGLQLLTKELDDLERRDEREVPGEIAFRLYDTHGFPIELTEEVASERGMHVDRPGFEGAMQLQQEQARQKDGFARKREEEAWTHLVKTLPSTNFDGYGATTGSSEILALLVDGKPAESVAAINGPREAVLVLAATPFYAETGGQVGDTGLIGNDKGTFQVADTKRPVPGLIAHYGRLVQGTLRVGSEVRTEVDAPRRQAIMRNHSATHLLHRALKDVLGEQTHQQGSLVAPDRLRFDFNLPRAITTEEHREIDRRVNEMVLSDVKVTTDVLPYREAIATGAQALFSEKYGDLVRVVTMGPSKELCGGTHVGATGEIGVYLTAQEASVGATTRRIEALTGVGARTWLNDRSDLLTQAAERLQTSPDTLVERIQTLQEELTEARRQLRATQKEQGREEAIRLAASAQVVRDVPVVAHQVSAADDRALRELGDAVRSRMGPGVIVLAAAQDDQARFIVTIDEATTKRGLNAGTIARIVGERLGGKGGGRTDSAQGGSKETAQLATTLAAVPDVIATLLS